MVKDITKDVKLYSDTIALIKLADDAEFLEHVRELWKKGEQPSEPAVRWLLVRNYGSHGPEMLSAMAAISNVERPLTRSERDGVLDLVMNTLSNTKAIKTILPSVLWVTRQLVDKIVSQEENSSGIIETTTLKRMLDMLRGSGSIYATLICLEVIDKHDWPKIFLDDDDTADSDLSEGGKYSIGRLSEAELNSSYASSVIGALYAGIIRVKDPQQTLGDINDGAEIWFAVLARFVRESGSESARNNAVTAIWRAIDSTYGDTLFFPRAVETFAGICDDEDDDEGGLMLSAKISWDARTMSALRRYVQGNYSGKASVIGSAYRIIEYACKVNPEMLTKCANDPQLLRSALDMMDLRRYNTRCRNIVASLLVRVADAIPHEHSLKWFDGRTAVLAKIFLTTSSVKETASMCTLLHKTWGSKFAGWDAEVGTGISGDAIAFCKRKMASHTSKSDDALDKTAVRDLAMGVFGVLSVPRNAADGIRAVVALALRDTLYTSYLAELALIKSRHDGSAHILGPYSNARGSNDDGGDEEGQKFAALVKEVSRVAKNCSSSSSSSDDGKTPFDALEFASRAICLIAVMDAADRHTLDVCAKEVDEIVHIASERYRTSQFSDPATMSAEKEFSALAMSVAAQCLVARLRGTCDVEIVERAIITMHEEARRAETMAAGEAEEVSAAAATKTTAPLIVTAWCMRYAAFCVKAGARTICDMISEEVAKILPQVPTRPWQTCPYMPYVYDVAEALYSIGHLANYTSLERMMVSAQNDIIFAISAMASTIDGYGSGVTCLLYDVGDDIYDRMLFIEQVLGKFGSNVARAIRPEFIGTLRLLSKKTRTAFRNIITMVRGSNAYDGIEAAAKTGMAHKSTWNTAVRALALLYEQVPPFSENQGFDEVRDLTVSALNVLHDDPRDFEKRITAALALSAEIGTIFDLDASEEILFVDALTSGPGRIGELLVRRMVICIESSGEDVVEASVRTIVAFGMTDQTNVALIKKYDGFTQLVEYGRTVPGMAKTVSGWLESLAACAEPQSDAANAARSAAFQLVAFMQTPTSGGVGLGEGDGGDMDV